MMELIVKRAQQLYEIDTVLFEGVELPVLIPDKIIESQKALIKKTLPTQILKKKSAGAGSAAELEASPVKTPMSRKFKSSITKAGAGLSNMLPAPVRPLMTQD